MTPARRQSNFIPEMHIQDDDGDQQTDRDMGAFTSPVMEQLICMPRAGMPSAGAKVLTWRSVAIFSRVAMWLDSSWCVAVPATVYAMTPRPRRSRVATCRHEDNEASGHEQGLRGRTARTSP